MLLSFPGWAMPTIISIVASQTVPKVVHIAGFLDTMVLPHSAVTVPVEGLVVAPLPGAAPPIR